MANQTAKKQIPDPGPVVEHETDVIEEAKPAGGVSPDDSAPRQTTVAVESKVAPAHSPELAEALFAKAVAGDSEAFWELVSPYRGLIYSVALAILKDAERAEDQLHDVLVTAFRSLSNLRDIRKLASWLYSMSRYRALEFIRREQRMRAVMKEAAHTSFRFGAGAEVEDKELWLTRMEQGLVRLPEGPRLLLAMKYTNNYSCNEIGDALEISIPAVKSRLFEARKQLRKLTEQIAAEEER